MKNTTSISTVLGAVAMASMTSHAATIATTAADARARNDGNVASGSANPIEVGGHGVGGAFNSSYVMPFLLPTLGAGESFDNANLSFYLEQVGTGIGAGEEADLYGLTRTNASATVAAADYFKGDNDASNTKLQDGILTSSSTVGNATWTDASGSTALTSWLNTQYDDGANAGDYVFLRISYNQAATPGANERFRIQPFENNDSDPVATITYDVIPEPSSAALFGLSALLGLLARRRR